jgi:hypothetical protein
MESKAKLRFKSDRSLRLKEQLRDAHLYGIKIPMLFFAGTRDALCDLKLL